MSDDASVIANLIAVVKQGQIVELNYFAATALFCFDYCLTLGQEINLVWKRGFCTSSILFYCVRYPALFSTLFVIMDALPYNGMSNWRSNSLNSCGILVYTDMVLNIILLTAAAVFSSLRVYALWDRSRWVLGGAVLLGMINPAISIYTFTQMEPVVITYPILACGFDSLLPGNVYENWMIGARMSAVVADVLVLAATWSRTWSMRTEASRINFTSTFAAILTRDGTMYFVVLLIANLIGLGLSRHIELVEPMSTWTAILTAILTSRFILDLHKAADGLGVAADAALTDLSTLPTLMFHTRTFPTEHMYGKNSVYGTVIPAIPTTATTEDSWDVSLSEEELGDARSSQKGSELLHLEEISNTTSRV